MAHQPLQQPPNLGEIVSREGLRAAVRQIFEWLGRLVQQLDSYQIGVDSNLERLYGEFDYTPAALANGAQTIVTVTVTNAILGYTVETSYDKDLQGLQMSTHVSAADTVKIVLKNDTGASVTLAAGRFRCYVTARELTA